MARCLLWLDKRDVGVAIAVAVIRAGTTAQQQSVERSAAGMYPEPVSLYRFVDIGGNDTVCFNLNSVLLLVEIFIDNAQKYTEKFATLLQRRHVYVKENGKSLRTVTLYSDLVRESTINMLEKQEHVKKEMSIPKRM